MKRFALLLAVAILAASTCVVLAADWHRGQHRRMVLYKFKKDASRKQLETVETSVRQLLCTIGGVEDVEFGDNISTENRSGGFTHCFFFTLKNGEVAPTLDAHPNVRRFNGLLEGMVEKTLTMDYMAR